MIKVILGIFGVAHLFPLWVAHLKPFPSAVGFTLRKFNGFTLRKTDGTELLITSANGKTRKQQAHLLSDDEVDELAVLLGINLYSAEDGRIFITKVTRRMIEGD